MSDEILEVTVIGGGPAGIAAAAYLAGERHSVRLVTRGASTAGANDPILLSVRVEPLLQELDVSTSFLGTPVGEVVFYNADFTKTAKPRLEGVIAYVVRRGDLEAAMRDAAIRRGVEFVDEQLVSEVRLNEMDVTLGTAEGRKWKSRLLIFAAGRNSNLAPQIGVRSDIGEMPLWTAQVSTQTEGQPGAPAVTLILGLDGGNGFGVCTRSPAGTSVAACVVKEPARVLEHLKTLCHGAALQKILPVDLSGLTSAAKIYRSPAGAALDLESHVAKHTLIIGDAGGFVSAASNEGVYPAILSAKLAAETVHAALKSKFSQDSLMAFDTTWRMQMADYLRSPHTDIRFLLPLIFSNQPMADRMGAAFFFGENM